MTDRAPQFTPYDEELEFALIGSFLVDSRTIAIAAQHVNPSDFYDPLHQQLVELIFELEEQGKAITPLTINTWAKHFPGMQDVGGLSYLSSLALAAPVRAPISQLAQSLVELRERRDALDSINEAAEGLAEGRAILPSLEGVVAVADIISSSQILKGADTAAHARGDVMLRQIQEQAVTDQVFGCRTGLDPLDELLGGLYPENQIVIGGRPGMGKSILACNLLLSAARQGWAADYWSIEMPGREVLARMQCDIDYDLAIREGLAPLHYEDLVKMRVTQEQLHRAAMANRELRDLDIHIFDQDRVTIGEISSTSRARTAREKGRPRLVVIDHMHIIMPEDRYRGRRVDELSEITGAGKRLAKRIGAPVIQLCQLSRDIEKRDDKRPFMSDFRDSGSIEQDADVVVSVYRGAYYAQAAIRNARNEEQRIKAMAEFDANRDVVELEVLKQRSGRTDTARCFIDVKSSVVRSSDPRRDTTAAQAAFELAKG
jgi:replicative DNA helicase